MLCKSPYPHTLESSQGGATVTNVENSFTAAMGYAVALEDKSKVQDEFIIELEASVDGKTFLTDTMDYSASAVSTGAIKELTEIRDIVKKLAASVTSQATTVATLSTNINSGASGAG